MEVKDLLECMIERGSGDLHLQSGQAPRLRIAGQLQPIDAPPSSDEQLRKWASEMALAEVRARLDQEGEADFGFEFEGKARFRVSAYREQGKLSMAFRLIPIEIPPFGELNLPHAITEVAQAPRGLILVTGTTGSGKSTTLAAMIDMINHSRAERIITIEDPIEFVHRSDKALIAQRELGSDTRSFFAALRVVLRQDPDIILVGELRDGETMRTALQAADTGHVVFSTMHTTNAAQTVQRMIALFPPDERDLILMQLAENLEAVVCQRLARTADNKSRVPVVEIMRSSPTIRKLLRKGEWSTLSRAIANQEQGMQLFDQHLAMLWKAEILSGRETLRHATNPESLMMIMKGVTTRELGAGLVSEG